MQPSQRWTLNSADFKRMAKNALVFLAPVVLTELTLVSRGVTDPQMYFVALQVWVLGVATDFFRKLQANS